MPPLPGLDLKGSESVSGIFSCGRALPLSRLRVEALCRCLGGKQEAGLSQSCLRVSERGLAVWCVMGPVLPHCSQRWAPRSLQLLGMSWWRPPVP